MTEFDKYTEGYNAHMQMVLGDYEYYVAHKAKSLRAAGLLRPNSRILDFGCGTGTLSVAMKRLDSSVHIDGYDVSSESVKRAPKELRDSGLYSSSLESLIGPYDLIVLTNVMHHVVPEGALR